jgi:hypothetical protein
LALLALVRAAFSLAGRAEQKRRQRQLVHGASSRHINTGASPLHDRTLKRATSPKTGELDVGLIFQEGLPAADAAEPRSGRCRDASPAAAATRYHRGKTQTLPGDDVDGRGRDPALLIAPGIWVRGSGNGRCVDFSGGQAAGPTLAISNRSGGIHGKALIIRQRAGAKGNAPAPEVPSSQLCSAHSLQLL